MDQRRRAATHRFTGVGSAVGTLRRYLPGRSGGGAKSGEEGRFLLISNGSHVKDDPIALNAGNHGNGRATQAAFKSGWARDIEFNDPGGQGLIGCRSAADGRFALSDDGG